MKILLALDDSPCSTRATNAVTAQFSPEHAEVLILHAEEWPTGLPTSVAFAAGAEAARTVEHLHELRQEDASALVNSAATLLRAAGFPATIAVRHGDPCDVILACASEWRADLIVLGSHGRKGLERLILGSVAEGVARRALCSVEIVRAETTAVAN
jgi:nucleotide-binding universal stress UspA family protein